jgi:GNAT superfamily N-acetyltransferase
MERPRQLRHISMIREDLDGISQYQPPAPYAVRWYRPGDEQNWLDIHLRADKYIAFTPETFGCEFGADAEELRLRQCYLCDPDGAAIGTTTAWYNEDYRGLPFGRVHWVAIVPEMQGRGLAKPMMSAVCHRLRELGHGRAYLTTATVRIPAICLYLTFGFRPEIESERDLEAWQQVRDNLPRQRRHLLRLD